MAVNEQCKRHGYADIVAIHDDPNTILVRIRKELLLMKFSVYKLIYNQTLWKLMNLNINYII